MSKGSFIIPEVQGGRERLGEAEQAGLTGVTRVQPAIYLPLASCWEESLLIKQDLLVEVFLLFVSRFHYFIDI